jgi:methylmalonyl-CoA/ethylmalonyl-CoA epimerase
VENVAEALREIEGTGIRVVDREPRPGAEGLSIGFLHPRSTLGVLIELCGKP